MYVVYEDVYVPYARKLFLRFIKGKWWHSGSDQKFRGVIVGYIGPMPSPKIDGFRHRRRVPLVIGLNKI
jgi:hypothetical protein